MGTAWRYAMHRKVDTAANRRKWNNRGQLVVMPMLQIEQWGGSKAQERMEAITSRYVLLLYRFTLRCDETMYYKGKQTFEDQH